MLVCVYQVDTTGFDLQLPDLGDFGNGAAANFDVEDDETFVTVNKKGRKRRAAAATATVAQLDDVKPGFDELQAASVKVEFGDQEDMGDYGDGSEEECNPIKAKKSRRGGAGRPKSAKKKSAPPTSQELWERLKAKGKKTLLSFE